MSRTKNFHPKGKQFRGYYRIGIWTLKSGEEFNLKNLKYVKYYVMFACLLHTICINYSDLIDWKLVVENKIEHEANIE